MAAAAHAQDARTGGANPFTAKAWHFEGEVQAGFEAWNYNGSHEDQEIRRQSIPNEKQLASWPPGLLKKSV